MSNWCFNHKYAIYLLFFVLLIPISFASGGRPSPPREVYALAEDATPANPIILQTTTIGMKAKTGNVVGIFVSIYNTDSTTAIFDFSLKDCNEIKLSLQSLYVRAVDVEPQTSRLSRITFESTQLLKQPITCTLLVQKRQSEKPFMFEQVLVFDPRLAEPEFYDTQKYSEWERPFRQRETAQRQRERRDKLFITSIVVVVGIISVLALLSILNWIGLLKTSIKKLLIISIIAGFLFGLVIWLLLRYFYLST